jgi:hypothetical protein
VGVDGVYEKVKALLAAGREGSGMSGE